jgi:4-amino-4-deoxy-L-arabinose transferase-like glycosyltransferase
LLRREQPPLLPGVALILAGAVALPVLLKVSVRGWESLFLTFAANGSDYIHDVPLIGSDPLGFLGRYVELSPTLAWHNSNHPPGSVLLLWGVEQVLGPGAVPASWVAILLSSLVVVAACWLGLRLGGRHLALLAGALVAVMPGHQVYSVTSMDGVFNSLLALAAVAFFLALEPGARPWRGLLAGVLLALGLFFTYATTQLFFFGVVVCLLALQRGQPLGHVLRQGMLAVGVLLLLYGLLAATTGFNILEAVLQAKANNARLLSDPTETNPGLMGLPSVSHYTYYLPVNLVPFLWYLAPWGLAALTPRLAAGVQNWRQPTSWHVLALALVGLVLGMWLSGLFVREVERIWGFIYPVAAVLMAVHIWQGETPRERLWRAGLWLTLFFAQAATMRMLLNTYW